MVVAFTGIHFQAEFWTEHFCGGGGGEAGRKGDKPVLALRTDRPSGGVAVVMVFSKMEVQPFPIQATKTIYPTKTYEGTPLARKGLRVIICVCMHAGV